MVRQTWLFIQTNSSGILLDELMASNFSVKILVMEDEGSNSRLGQRDISKP